MTYLFSKMKEDWHELQQLAESDWKDARKKSCVKAIQDVAIAKKKREKAIKEADKLSKLLMEVYDEDDEDKIADALDKITKNLRD